MKEDFPDFKDLPSCAVEPRYPGDLPEATEDDARDAVGQARKVYETTLLDLKRHGYTEE